MNHTEPPEDKKALPKEFYTFAIKHMLDGESAASIQKNFTENGLPSDLAMHIVHRAESELSHVHWLNRTSNLSHFICGLGLNFILCLFATAMISVLTSPDSNTGYQLGHPIGHGIGLFVSAMATQLKLQYLFAGAFTGYLLYILVLAQEIGALD
ncbi:hypothetical protein [Pedosphaera parvula]|uniref:Uncharacterized protein n=1 Tax=Pedosphaera parvula (strain Ellin514) TaxID=320771 RepID=B9XBM0_PEDPL|nr:hypothetical protein [Pedosphaera parvula]EEF62905.1 hypothetical protein Cflav_PD5540 [Pedosphaera parvula Ellin514]